MKLKRFIKDNQFQTHLNVIYSVAICMLGSFIHFNLLGDQVVSMQWIAVIICTALFSMYSALLGLLISILSTYAFYPELSKSLIQTNHIFTTIKALSLILSSFSMQFLKHRKPITQKISRMILLVSSSPLLILIYCRNISRLNVALAIGIIITTILTLLKSRQLGMYFFSPYLSWLIGYIFYFTMNWFFQSDNGAAGIFCLFFQRNYLALYPVFLLELLILAHLWIALKPDEL